MKLLVLPVANVIKSLVWSWIAMFPDAFDQFSRILNAAGCARYRFWMYDHNRWAE